MHGHSGAHNALIWIAGRVQGCILPSDIEPPFGACHARHPFTQTCRCFETEAVLCCRPGSLPRDFAHQRRLRRCGCQGICHGPCCRWHSPQTEGKAVGCNQAPAVAHKKGLNRFRPKEVTYTRGGIALFLVAWFVEPVGEHKKAQQAEQQDDGGSGSHGFSLGLKGLGQERGMSIAHEKSRFIKAPVQLARAGLSAAA